MRLTRIGAMSLAGLFVVAACSNGAGSSPAASRTPSTAPSMAASMAPTSMPSSMSTQSMAPGSMAPASMSTESMAPMSMAPGSMSPMSPGASNGTSVVVDSPAANLRVDLNYLLGEHQILAAKATDAALGGRTDEFNAYAALLNTNGTDLGATLGDIYGQDAQDKFNEIWSAHNGFFVDYTTGVATKNTDMQQKAVDDLTTIYVPQFTDFLVAATGLPADAVEELVTDHVLHTKAIVDAQAAGDWSKAYDEIRHAYAHIQMIGDALAPAIAEKNSIEGDSLNAGVGFRVALDQLLQEHLFLATFATGAAIGGRTDEFTAAANALNENGTDIGAALGKIYGQDAQDKFNEIWSAHNGFFVDYTTGVATDDQAKKDKAVSDLTTIYVPQFADFLAGATGLPKADLQALIADHVTTTAAVVDAQGSDDVASAADADRTAAMHMRMIGDPLAAAIVASMPDAFSN